MSGDFEFLNFDEFDSDSGADAEAGLDFADDTDPALRLPGGAGVVIVDDDQAVVDYLAGLFNGGVETATSLIEAESMLDIGSKVVVLGPSCTDPADLSTVSAWGRRLPHVATVLVTSELTTQLLHKALQAGVRDVLSAPINAEQLMDTVVRVADGLPSAQQLASVGPDPALAPMADGEVGRVISIFSTKGGSGKSVTATNLGVAMARRSSKPVVLIDGHMQFGDVAVMLKLQPDRTVVDAIADLDRLDASMLPGLLMTHEPSGLQVLAAPTEPTVADQITGEQVAQLIEKVRGYAGHVIVDLPAIFNEVVLSVIESADEIILVAGLDIPNVKNVKIGLQTLAMLSVPVEKLHLVLNRANSKVKLDVSEVERTLGVDALRVPSDVVVPISVNKGSPVVLSAPKSGPARAFEQLATQFMEGIGTKSEAVQGGRRRFFG